MTEKTALLIYRLGFVVLVYGIMIYFVISGSVGFNITITHIHKFETPIEINDYMYVDYPDALKEIKELIGANQAELEVYRPHIKEFIRMTSDLNNP